METNGEFKQLTLSRCYGEAVQIEGPCIVTVREAKGRRVGLTFQAVESTVIRRLEIVPAGERLTGELDLSMVEMKRREKFSPSPAPAPFRMAGIKTPNHRVS